MKRSTFLYASGALAAGATRAQAQTVPGGTHLVERFADFDEDALQTAVNKPADVRQLWEAVSFHPAVLGNIKNSLNGLRFGFGYMPERIAMVFTPHGPSGALTYSDAIWQKYALARALKLNDAAGAPLSGNTFIGEVRGTDADNPDDTGGFFQQTSIAALQRRGVVFLTCHTSVEEQARVLVNGGFAPAGAAASDVAADILQNLIPGAIVVPSMVATIAVLQQRYGYSYITPTYA